MVEQQFGRYVATPVPWFLGVIIPFLPSYPISVMIQEVKCLFEMSFHIFVAYGNRIKN
jgi:hypothetical protein